MSKARLKNKTVTTTDTIKALRKDGIEISENEAEKILDFLYFLAKLTVNQYVNNKPDK
ncbi:hypothetical protein [Mucilaginibacter gilvus]|uniref:hypothetical protein n=1 Tax=Mucilaginibacter gilvus TaxID=2305909 RepID=UPI00141A00DC|nr:hypothetical protein [Mucilaginibacter gilvus]